MGDDDGNRLLAAATMIQVSSTRALIRAMGMQATNASFTAGGAGAPRYTERDFVALIEDEGIGHNQIMEVLRG